MKKKIFQFLLDYIFVNTISALLAIIIGGMVGSLFHLINLDASDYQYIFKFIAWLCLGCGYYYLEIKKRPIKYKLALALCVCIIPLIIDYKGLYDFMTYLIVYATPMPIAYLIHKSIKSRLQNSE